MKKLVRKLETITSLSEGWEADHGLRVVASSLGTCNPSTKTQPMKRTPLDNADPARKQINTLVEAKVNARWSLDFVHDQFACRRRFRILGERRNVIDAYAFPMLCWAIARLPEGLRDAPRVAALHDAADRDVRKALAEESLS
ncbi:hypothetical protein QO058_11570 [Bosea vestrisii]|uniref:hypothetical protein n=1 Tax=Bosea vestrisii TaxID=151416 RepID=UPI0024DF72F4|nr:hypothetical protein [Bosea vestrisii]WID99654.1 hypothetical protein QO058_11570 [Bosea vestrisii]